MKKKKPLSSTNIQIQGRQCFLCLAELLLYDVSKNSVHIISLENVLAFKTERKSEPSNSTHKKTHTANIERMKVTTTAETSEQLRVCFTCMNWKCDESITTATTTEGKKRSICVQMLMHETKWNGKPENGAISEWNVVVADGRGGGRRGLAA